MRRLMIAVTLALALPLTAASAQRAARVGARGTVRQEMGDVRVAKRELREDLRQRNRAAMMGNRRRVWQETREIRHDRRVLQRQSRDVKRAIARRRFGR